MRKEMLVQYLKQIERKPHVESVQSSHVLPRSSEEDIQEVGKIVLARP
jgi:hypothetical protein